MWSIVSGCGVPLKNPMIIAPFVSAMASSDRNISCRSKFSVQNCALFSGSLTATLKCQTAPSCTFTSVPLRNASSRGLCARMMRPNACCYGRRVKAGLHDTRHSSTFFLRLLHRLRSAENYFDHAVWLREHRHMTRIEFGRLGFHAFCKKTFKIRVDGVILLSDNVPTRFGLPRNARCIVREDVSSRRALCRPHELLLSRREIAAKIL